MLRSRLALLAALALPACTATTTSNGPVGDDPSDPSTPTTPTTPTDPKPTDPKPTDPPAKVVFEYSTVPMPAANLSIGSIGGSSASDVWIVGIASTATQQDPWNAYHYDGTKWTTQTLTAQKGRPNFGTASLGGSAYFGFSYSGEVFQLAGTSLTKVATFSVTSGYSMATVGQSVFVGTQENFGAGPLYKISGGTSKQVAGLTKNLGGVQAIWGASEDDVWLARSESLGRLQNGAYSDVDTAAGVSDVHGTAKDDVWAVGEAGVKHFDGTKWSPVTFPVAGSSRYDQPSRVTAHSKDEVIVTSGDGKVYRLENGAFVKESRPSAPKATGQIGRIGNEAWMIDGASISRLAPKK